MGIRFACPTCKKALNAPDDRAGVRVTCPGCKQPLKVPTPSVDKATANSRVDAAARPQGPAPRSMPPLPPSRGQNPRAEPSAQPEENKSRISTPALLGIIGGGVVAVAVLIALVVAVPLLLLGGKNTGGASGPGGDRQNAGLPGLGGGTTSGPAKGSENAKAPGRSEAPDPRLADAAKEAMAAFSDVDYSKGPSGESLDYKEWVDGDFKIKAPGFQEGKKFIKHGLVTVWYATGEKESEAYWRSDKRHGPMTVWHRNGRKMREARNKDGFVDGYSVEWYDNGSKKFEGVFKSGRKEGMFITYYRNGNLMREVEFSSGRPKLPTEQWFDAEGVKAAGPTVKSLNKDDFVEIMNYLLKEHTGDVYGSFLPPDARYGRKSYEITANFNFEFYMRFFGRPDTGFDPDFVNHARQVWTYSYLDGAITLRVFCGRPVAGKEGIIPGKAERVIVEGISF